jgi:hypothetical protein
MLLTPTGEPSGRIRRPTCMHQRAVIAVCVLAAGCSSGSMMDRGSPPTVGPHPRVSCPATSCAWHVLAVPQLDVTMSVTGMTTGRGGEIWLAGRAGAGWSKPQPSVDASWARAPDHNVMVHWDGSRWQRVPLPTLASPLTGLTTAPSGQVWAVEGDHLARYDGRRWRQVDGALPRLGAGGDVGLAMDATGGWLATTRGTRIGNRPWTARWDGHRWHRVATPAVGTQSQLTAVASLSAGDAWAFGFHDVRDGHSVDVTKTSGLLIEHWDGRRWRITPQPVYHNSKRNFDVVDATMVSPSEGWAVGSQTYAGGGRIHPLVLRYNGRRWRIMRFPYCCAGAALTAIVSRGNQVWVAGTGSGPAGYQTLVERWTGRRWIREPSLNLGGTRVTDIGITGSGAVVVAATGSNPNGTSYPLLQRWAGQR